MPKLNRTKGEFLKQAVCGRMTGILPLILASCGMVARQDGNALAVANKTAQYRLSCEDVAAERLSKREGWYTNYTFGVKGCGKSEVYPVKCMGYDCEVELDMVQGKDASSPPRDQ